MKGFVITFLNAAISVELNRQTLSKVQTAVKRLSNAVAALVDKLWMLRNAKMLSDIIL